MKIKSLSIQIQKEHEDKIIIHPNTEGVGLGTGGVAPLQLILGLGSITPPILNDHRKILSRFCCLQVEIILDGVAVDSLDTHCCDHLCAYVCCSGYFCQTNINDKPTSRLESKWQCSVTKFFAPPIQRSFHHP